MDPCRSRKKMKHIPNKNINLKKPQNYHLSKRGSPWFLTKNGHFSIVCFREKVFGEVLERKWSPLG